MTVMRLPPELEQELNQCGLPWHLKQGKKHFMIVVGGVVVGCISLSPQAARRDGRQLRRNVRQRVRQRFSEGH